MKYNEARILFMGTPQISAYVLNRMIQYGFNVVALVSQPDRPVGRKHVIMPTPTKEVATKYNIPVYQPEKIRRDYEFVRELNPDLIITLAYGQILPEGLLNIPSYGCLNLHGSLLPKYRGAAPIQYALINNEEYTGMSLMEMTKDMDAGRIYATQSIKINEEDNDVKGFKSGMIMMAMRGGVPIIPVYIKRRKHFYSRLEVAFGSPVDVSAFKAGSSATQEEIKKACLYLEEKERELEEFILTK